MTPRDIMAAARLRVYRRFPYLSAVLFNLRFVAKPGIQTMATDAGWRCYYEPALVSTIGVDGAAPCVWHEVMHCLLDHLGRRCDRDAFAWNCACDRTINPMKPDDWRWPFRVLMPADIGMNNGLTAAEYYRVDEQEGGGAGDPGAGVGQGRCGGCAGNPHEWEAAAGADGATPDPVDPTSQQVNRRVVASGIKAHEQAHGRGSVPAALSCWADKELAPPKIPWQQVLRSLVKGVIADRMGQSDYSYRRMSRRYPTHRTIWGKGAPILPALVAPIPRIVGILDTSGSMGGARLEAALAEVVGIVRATGVPVLWLAVDAAVHVARNVIGKRDLVALAVGGGGTDMALGLREADKRKADLLILITDGETGWPAEGEIRTKTIVCCVTDAEVPAHVGKVVRVELDQRE